MAGTNRQKTNHGGNGMNGHLENLQAANRETSLPIPNAWIERLWDRLKTMYGAKFIDLWRDVDPIQLKQAWAEEFAGYTANEIKRGLEACKIRPFPPTLPELLTLCRPAMTAESAFYEAVEQIRRRPDGRDKWSHPAVYWAAVKIGAHDLQNMPWPSIKGRWTAAYEDTMSAGIWPEIPPYRASIPAPGQQSISREEAKKRASELGLNVKTEAEKKDSKAWAERIFQQYAQGIYDLDIGLKLAEEALGRIRPQRLKHAA